MRNFLKCSTLIRVAIIMVVMAFMASQVTDTYAGGSRNDQKRYPGAVLPAGGKTIAGPGVVDLEKKGADLHIIHYSQFGTGRTVCVTVANIGYHTLNLEFSAPGAEMVVDRGQTVSICAKIAHAGIIRLRNPAAASKGVAIWRIDTAE